jgi:hypothetical protein
VLARIILENFAGGFSHYNMHLPFILYGNLIFVVRQPGISRKA